MGWNDREASQIDGEEVEDEDEVAGGKADSHKKSGR